MVKENILTYQDAIEDFFDYIKQIPMDKRDMTLERIITELSSSNLTIAHKILDYLQTGINIVEPESAEDQNYLNNLFAQINNISVTDYNMLNQETIKLKNDKHACVIKYIQKQEYNNYCILEKRALEKNNQLDLQEIDNELITKANEGNSFFKERLDVKEWLDYLEKNDKFNLNNKSMTA